MDRIKERILKDKPQKATVLYLHRSLYNRLGNPSSLFDTPIQVNETLKRGTFAWGVMPNRPDPNGLKLNE